ncbi:MAG TPA: RsmB/NOP family class I SAM-dependent RNA methyltransferase [Rhodocyclaceae bacterium]|nr:RsmB/NOP family class I SAM-dependent RNA methyltransferase [Rhodocyclaceae bacterium]
MRITEKLLAATVDAATDMLKFNQPADGVLSTHFKVDRTGSHDRAFIAETAYAVLRRKRLLDRLAGPGATPRQLVLAALVRLQGCNQRQLAEAVSARELEWLAQFKAQSEPELTLAEQADLPDWLVARLLGRMGADELLAMARGLNQPAPLDLRVNPMKVSRDETLARLKADGIEAEACRYAPMGIRLKGRPSLSRHPLYLEGKIEVQDEGSQLLGHLLQPKRGEMVIDFCAGAGGKTLLLGALMRSTGRLYAFDVAEKRLAKLKPRVARSGLSNVHPVCITGENDIRVKRLAGKIDRVLVDAPCSGLGTLRRNPDLKWRQTPESVAELTRKQADILAGASRLVKAGGRLVYATCSILPEENEMIVDAFLATHGDFARLSAVDMLAKQGIDMDVGQDLSLLPHTHGTDGFYAAVLERSK